MKLLYEVYISFLYLAWVCFHPWIFHENECGFTKRKTASSEYEDSQRIPFNSTMLLYTGMSEGFILSYNVRLLQQKCAFGVLFCRLVPTWESIKYTDMPQVLCLSLKLNELHSSLLYFCTTMMCTLSSSFPLEKATHQRASQVARVVKNLPANTGDERDVGLIPGLGRSPGERNGNLFQYSCLENPMDRGVWWATVLEITKSWIWLKRHSMHACVLSQKREPFRSFRNHWNLDISHKG